MDATAGTSLEDSTLTDGGYVVVFSLLFIRKSQLFTAILFVALSN